VPLSTRANGLDGFDTVLEFNNPLHVKHLEALIELQKDKTFDYSGRTNTGEGRFTAGECPLFLTSSAFFGNVKANAKFDFANAPMPYYPARVTLTLFSADYGCRGSFGSSSATATITNSRGSELTAELPVSLERAERKLAGTLIAARICRH
jgi:ABC-type glycerol-3-phosphate transport system substrate-binding protein